MVAVLISKLAEKRLGASGCGGKDPGMGARRAADGVIIDPDELDDDDDGLVGIIVALDEVDDAAERVPARSGG